MVSFVVPVFNAEKYIEKCLDSICHQTYKEIEIIVVDDGSSDQSLSIVTRIASNDARIRVYHQENQGVSSARNTGIHRALGEYLQFVDADDVIEHEMTEALLQRMQSLNADLIMCSFSSTSKSIPEFSEVVIDGFFNYFEHLIQASLIQGPCNKIYKTSIIKENEILFPTEYSKLEDSIFNAYYVSCCKKICFIPKRFYHYSNTPGSLSKASSVHEVKALLRVYDILLKTPGIKEKDKKQLLCYVIKQAEVTCRVCFMKSACWKETLKLWETYRQDIMKDHWISALLDCVRKSSLRFKVFFYLLSREHYRMLRLYFRMIEFVKKRLKSR